MPKSLAVTLATIISLLGFFAVYSAVVPDFSASLETVLQASRNT